MGSAKIQAVSLDAFGTILELTPPAPALVRELRDGWGVEVSLAEAERALIAEITYYKAHQLDGSDDASLADLRLRCARMLAENLPEAARGQIGPAELLPAMMRSLQFWPFADVVDALERFRGQGLKLVVVSNWDVSLTQVLGTCGLLPYVDHIVASAAVGAAKPSPAPFERALELLGMEPSSVVHIGDEPGQDVAGAIAAGIAPVLIRRREEPGGSEPERNPAPPAPGPDRTPSAPGVPVITTLTEFTAELATGERR